MHRKQTQPEAGSTRMPACAHYPSQQGTHLSMEPTSARYPPLHPAYVGLHLQTMADQPRSCAIPQGGQRCHTDTKAAFRYHPLEPHWRTPKTRLACVADAKLPIHTHNTQGQEPMRRSRCHVNPGPGATISTATIPQPYGCDAFTMQTSTHARASIYISTHSSPVGAYLSITPRSQQT